MQNQNEFVNDIDFTVNTSQYVYDAFNSLMFSKDTKVLGKLLSRAYAVRDCAYLPGDVVEAGVFKGSGMMAFMKIQKLLSPGSSPWKVIGFDYFNTADLLKNLSGNDKDRMSSLFSSRNFELNETYCDELRAEFKSAGFVDGEDYELVPGDISVTSREYVKYRPGFRISLLFMDLDLEQPTYETLVNLWPRVIKGGIVMFDQYGLNQWSEAAGVDEFFRDKDVEIRSNCSSSPTAYVVKK